MLQIFYVKTIILTGFYALLLTIYSFTIRVRIGSKGHRFRTLAETKNHIWHLWLLFFPWKFTLAKTDQKFDKLSAKSFDYFWVGVYIAEKWSSIVIPSLTYSHPISRFALLMTRLGWNLQWPLLQKASLRRTKLTSSSSILFVFRIPDLT